MWTLLILVLVTAAADDRGWAYPLRFEIGPVSFNLFLIVLTAAFFVALFRRGHHPLRWPTPTAHPLLPATLGLFAAALLVGMLGLFMMDPTLILIRDVGFGIRDYLALPVAIFIGYRLIASPDSGRRFAYAMLAGGVAASACVVLSIFFKSQSLSATANINQFRTTAYEVSYAALALGLVLFAVAANVRWLPKWLVLSIGGACIIGIFLTLHRSTWIACIAGMAAIPLVLPPHYRRRTITAAFLATPFLLLGLWVAVFAASRWTGRNYVAVAEERIVSLLPSERQSGKQKAWDTRVGAAGREIEMWMSNPIMGRGFGVHQHVAGILSFSGAHHNAWTDTLAKTGLIGLIPAALVIGGCVVIGRRMVRDQVHPAFVLIGGLGAVTGLFYFTHGMATWSFNSLRGAICLGVIFGALLRCRAMQLTQLQPIAQAEGAEGWGLPQHPSESFELRGL